MQKAEEASENQPHPRIKQNRENAPPKLLCGSVVGHLAEGLPPAPLDYAAGVAAFAARRRSRNRRTALIKNHNPGMITINQGTMAATAVMRAARLSPRTEPKSRSASLTDAKEPRLIVRCSARKAISTYTFSVSLARTLRCVASLSSSA